MSREQTSASCETCAHMWPAGKVTPNGDRYYVPTCRKCRNHLGLCACTLSASIDGPCGPELKLWRADT